MTWFKIDDSWYDHPKVAGLSDSAVALWVRAGTYCARHLTDGFISSRQARRMCDDPEAAIGELVEAGLWEKVPGGYRFHDWSDYQPSREEVLATSKAKSVGGAIGNHRRWHVDRGRVEPGCPYCTPGSHRTSDRSTDSEPNRPTRPDPTRPEPPPPPADDDAEDPQWEEQVVDQALSLRPDWLADDVRQALRHRKVRQRPPDVACRAMLLVAADPDTDRPSRLAANHQHWGRAAAQLAAERARRAGPAAGRVPAHPVDPDGHGGCVACPLPARHRVHDPDPTPKDRDE